MLSSKKLFILSLILQVNEERARRVSLLGVLKQMDLFFKSISSGFSHISGFFHKLSKSDLDLINSIGPRLRRGREMIKGILDDPGNIILNFKVGKDRRVCMKPTISGCVLNSLCFK